MVQGSGFRFLISGFGVQSSVFRVQGSEIRIQGVGGRHARLRVLSRAHENFISRKVCSKPFRRSQPPPKSVDLSFTMTNAKIRLTDLCGN